MAVRDGVAASDAYVPEPSGSQGTRAQRINGATENDVYSEQMQSQGDNDKMSAERIPKLAVHIGNNFLLGILYSIPLSVI